MKKETKKDLIAFFVAVRFFLKRVIYSLFTKGLKSENGTAEFGVSGGKPWIKKVS